MIGRDGPVNRFETIRWARAQAEDPRLTDHAAWLLVVLATFCDEQTKCYPSLKTLERQTRRKRRAVIYSLRRLEELQLIWTDQGGHGRTATRQLLFNPAVDSLDKPAMRTSEPLAVHPRLHPPVHPRLHPEVPRKSQYFKNLKSQGSSAPKVALLETHPRVGDLRERQRQRRR